MKTINIIVTVSVILTILSWSYVLFCPFSFQHIDVHTPSLSAVYNGVTLFKHTSYGNAVFVYDPGISKDKIFAQTPNKDYFKGVARDKDGVPAFNCPTNVNGDVEFGNTVAKYNTKALRWECDAVFQPVSLEG